MIVALSPVMRQKFILFFKNYFIILIYFYFLAVQLHGTKPTPPVLEVWSLNHWTTREILRQKFKQRNLSRLLDSRKFETEFDVYV